MHECSGFSQSSPSLVILHLFFFFFYSLFIFKSLWFFPLGSWWMCQEWKVAAWPSCVGQVPRGPRGSRFTVLPLLRVWWCMWPVPGGTLAHPGLHTLAFQEEPRSRPTFVAPGGSLPASLFTVRVSPPRSPWTSSLEIPSSFVLSLYPPYWSVSFVKTNLTFITLEGPPVSEGM